MPSTAEGSTRKGKLQQIQELRSRLKSTNDLKEKAKIYAQLLELPENSVDFSENVDPEEPKLPDLEKFVVPANPPRIQSIPLLPSGANCHGPSLSSFEPSAEECSSITSSEEANQVRQPGRSRTQSVSSCSSASSRPKHRNSQRRRSITPGRNDMNDRPLDPDAQRRIFNYEFRGPIPAHHHCRRSLFGSGSIDVPQTETPKKPRNVVQKKKPKSQSRSRSFDRVFLSSSKLTPEDAVKRGLTLHQLNCEDGCGNHSNTTTAHTSSLRFSERRIPKSNIVVGSSNEFTSAVQKRLDNWQPMNFNRSKSADPVSASTPTVPDGSNIPQQDEDGYAIPSIVSSVSSPQRPLAKSPLEPGSTPQNLYRTPMTEFPKTKSSDEDSDERYFTPGVIASKKRNLPDCGSANRIGSSDIQNVTGYTAMKDIQSTKAKIDEVIALLNSPVFKSNNPVKSQSLEKKKVQHLSKQVDSVDRDSRVQQESLEDGKGSSTLKDNTSKKIDFMNIDDTPQLNRSKVVNSANPKDVSPTTKEIALWTSLTREKLCKEFHATLQMNVAARRKFCMAELGYAKKNGNYEVVKKAEKYLKDLSSMEEKTKNQVEELLKIYNKENVSLVVRKIKQLQAEIKKIIQTLKRRESDRTRKSFSFSIFGELNVDSFEKEVIAGFNERLEAAKKVVNILKNTSEKEKAVQKMEKKAVRMLVRHVVGKATAESVPISSSTEAELTESSSRQSGNRKPMGSLIPKPRRESNLKKQITEKSTTSDDRVFKSSTSSILSSTQSRSKIPVFSNKRKIGFGQNYNFEENNSIISEKCETQNQKIKDVLRENLQPDIVIPRSPAEQLIPKLDFSSFKNDSEKEKTQNKSENNFSDLAAGDVFEEKTKETDVEDFVEKDIFEMKEVESGGRTSRDVSSIAEIEPFSKIIEFENDEKKEVYGSDSTLKDDDSVLSEEEKKSEIEVVQNKVEEEKKQESAKSDDSVFSVLPSSGGLSSGRDLQSLPDFVDEEEQKQKDVQPTNIAHGDSDPERVPSTGSTVMPSAISSSKLLDRSESPVPSPPHVEEVPIDKSESLISRNEEKLNEKEEGQLLEDIKTPSEISDIAVEALQSASESSATSTSSHVVVPNSMEEDGEVSAETPVESAKTTSESTESSTTTSSVGTTVSEQSTTEVSSSSTTTVEKKDDSVSESIPEELPSTAKSSSITDSSPLVTSNGRLAKNHEDESISHAVDDVSEISQFNLSNSGFDSSAGGTRYRRKSWETVVTGTLKKNASPTYVQGEKIDSDIGLVFVNPPPKFKSSTPPPLTPFAAVSPRSPRNSLENRKSLSPNAKSPTFSRSFNFSKSPPAQNWNHTVDVGENLLDFNLSDVAAPIFEGSGSSGILNLDKTPEGGSPQKDVFNWSPGFTQDLIIKPSSENSELTNIQSITKTTVELFSKSDDETETTEFGETPLEMTEDYCIKILKRFCRDIWPEYEKRKNGKNGKLVIKIAPVPFEHPERFHRSYERLIADTVCSSVEKLLKRNTTINSEEIFTNEIQKIVLNTFALERPCELFDRRHRWNVMDEPSTDVFVAFRNKLVYDHCEKRKFMLPDFVYQECIKYLEKNAPKKLIEIGIENKTEL